MKIIIVADDLTGAADTGIQFLSLAGRSLKMVGLDHKISSAPSGGLAVHTETRNESPFTAKLAMDRVADVVRRFGPDIVYKKIDSCLRGHLGLELAALIDNLNFKGALVAPAYPTFGRVTREGLHYVGEKLVSESEVAKDPIRPVTDSRLAALLGQGGHDLKVESLDLKVIRQGVEAVAAAIESLLKGPLPVLIAADAADDGDLDILAEAGLRFRDSLVLTGSAGLAGGIARKAGADGGQEGDEGDEGDEELPSGPVIYFGGSATRTLEDQVARLVEAGLAESVAIDVNELLNKRGDLPQPPEPQRGRDLAVVLTPPADDAPAAGKDFSRRLITTFAYYAAALVRARKPSVVFISGGDTAQAILSCLNLKEVWLKSEPLPGLVYMKSGRISIITKAGSFGDADMLVRLSEKLFKKG